MTAHVRYRTRWLRRTRAASAEGPVDKTVDFTHAGPLRRSVARRLARKFAGSA